MAELRCLVCDQIKLNSYIAILAPWIRQLCNLPVDLPTSFLECKYCGFGSFSYRYSESDMKSIYEHYRGPEYVKVRRSWEPWYTVNEADYYKLNNSAVDNRNDFMRSSFESAKVDFATVNSVLDFGGDLGQFIPDEILGEKYLLDPSNVPLETENGIVRVSDLKQVPIELDLIMNCHTLEHLSDFQTVVDDIYSSIKKGGYFYLEVPLDGFKVKTFHGKRIYNSYLQFVQSKRSILILANFLTGVFRQLFRRIPYIGVIQQSEHINYFGQKSLEILLKRSGFEVLSVQGPDFGFQQGKIRLGRIGILSKKPN
jgi:SAM-dependent methyltransferase